MPLRATLPQVVTWCRERNIVCIPGCTTPSELYKAYKVALAALPLFPTLGSQPQ